MSGGSVPVIAPQCNARIASGRLLPSNLELHPVDSKAVFPVASRLQPETEVAVDLVDHHVLVDVNLPVRKGDNPASRSPSQLTGRLFLLFNPSCCSM